MVSETKCSTAGCEHIFNDDPDVQPRQPCPDCGGKGRTFSQEISFTDDFEAPGPSGGFFYHGLKWLYEIIIYRILHEKGKDDIATILDQALERLIPEIEAIHSELPSEDAGEDTIKEAIQVVLNEKNRKSYVLTLYLQSEGVKRAIAEQDASLAAFHMAHAMAARAMIIFIEKLHRPIWQGYSFGYSERFLSDLRRDLTAGHSEEHWQKKLTDNPFLLTLLFAHPVVVVAQKAYVGGKTVENRDGMIVDYLVKNALTGGSALIEIKRPNTPLLGSEYRNGVYSIHAEVSGAVNQVLTYRNQLILEYSSITMNNGEADAEQYEAFNPPCIVVAGNVSDELSDSQKRRSFELYRNSLAGVQIIGYDELVKRAQALTGAFKASFPD